MEEEDAEDAIDTGCCDDTPFTLSAQDPPVLLLVEDSLLLSLGSTLLDSRSLCCSAELKSSERTEEHSDRAAQSSASLRK